MNPKMLAGLCACTLSAAAVAEPTTLKWTGGGNDRLFSTANNWSGDTSKFTDTTVGVVLDLSAAPAGAVLTNDFTAKASCCLAGVKLGASQTVELFSAKPTGASLRFLNGGAFAVPAGSVLRLNLYMDNNWDGGKTFKITGGGEVRYLSGVFIPYKWELDVAEGSTLRFDSAATGANGLGMTLVKLLDSTAKLALERDMAVEGVTCAAGATPTIELNGHALKITGGEAGRASDLTGVVWSGGDAGCVSFTGGATGAVKLPASGLKEVSVGRSALTADAASVTSADIAVNGEGYIAFAQSAQVAALTGTGLSGGVSLGEGVTLAVAGDAAGRAYPATLFGKGGLKKVGAETAQTLSGRNSYEGATVVEAGTLTIDAGAPFRPGETFHLGFEDADAANLLADTAESRLRGVAIVPAKDISKGFEAVLPTVVADGISGQAIRLSPDNHAYYRFDGKSAAFAPLKNGNAFTVSFWIRLSKENPYYYDLSYLLDNGKWADGKHFLVYLHKSGNVGFSYQNNWNAISRQTGDGTYVQSDLADGYLSDGAWHQVVISYADQKAEIKVDAVHKTSQTFAAAMDIADADMSLLGIGSDTQSAYCPECDLDDLIVSDHVWSDAEIAQDFARKPYDRAALLPAPVAHWNFNDAADIGRDGGPNGLALVAARDRAPTVGTDARCYGKALYAIGSMKLEGGVPTAIPTGSKPFTVSVRYRMNNGAGEHTALVAWGSPTETRYFQIGIAGAPRTTAFYGASGLTSPTLRFTDDGQAAPDSDGGWTHVVATYDPQTQKLTGYRDGALVVEAGNIELDLGSDSFYVGYNANGEKNPDALVDDLQIFDRALTAEQVKILARALETGSAGPVLPAASPVTVAAGATLAVKGEGHVIRSLAGAGTVSLANGAALTLAGGSDFAGKLLGNGLVEFATDASLKSAEQVTANVRYPENAVIDGAETPVLVTTGTVCLPATATIRLSSPLDVGTYTLLKGGRLRLASSDLSGWTVEGLPSGTRYKLRVTDTEVQVSIKGGLALIIR